MVGYNVVDKPIRLPDGTTERRPVRVPDIREVSARREADCRRKLDALKAAVAQGSLSRASGRDTVAAFLTRWLEAIGLAGLTWDDIDEAHGVLHIRRILLSSRGGVPRFGEPKTARSRRRIPLPADALAALRAHRDRQAFDRRALGKDYDYAPYDLVFATPTRGPITHSLKRRHWRQALAAANLPATTRLHDLRHFAATSMLAGGVDVPTVSAILGHARVSTTLDVYSHAIPANLRRATDTLADTLAQAISASSHASSRGPAGAGA